MALVQSDFRPHIFVKLVRTIAPREEPYRIRSGGFFISRAAQVALERTPASKAAMAHARDLLADGHWQRAELTAVVEQAVAPYPSEWFEITGVPVQLPQRAVASLSLALASAAFGWRGA